MRSLLQARIASIWSILAEFVVGITVPRVDYHAFKLKVTLADGSTLQINEQYYHDTLERYAYYWLDRYNRLLIGWDNVLRTILTCRVFLTTSMWVRKTTYNLLKKPPLKRSSLLYGLVCPEGDR